MGLSSKVTSDFSELEGFRLEGEKVAVGFRPSGELHAGNLLSIAYAAVVASELGLKLEVACCDTDWSAHMHEQTMPSESKVMKLFFERDCPCDEHDNIAEHRLDEIKPFLEGLRRGLGVDIETYFLSNLQGDEDYLNALRKVLENMEAFDGFFGGGFRRRYDSPVANVCSCGHSYSKGAGYSSSTDELVSNCRNPNCNQAFAASSLEGKIGVYYLVDPVRDVSRNVAVHVFGGDYRAKQKEQKTSKVEKVVRITELANGETPYYFLAPMIADDEGKPLSKSKGTGKTVSEIGDLEKKGVEMAVKVSGWLSEEKRHVAEQELV